MRKSLRGILENHCKLFALKYSKLSVRKILQHNHYMLVFGDSAIWGQGLLDRHKYSYIVEKDIRDNYTRGDVKRLVFAHSGAKIGIHDHKVKKPLPGEVNVGHPTILQQINAFTGLKKTVKLILVNGGINDVKVNTILNPLKSNDSLKKDIDKYCHIHLKMLLKKIIKEYPNSKIIVTGYFPVISSSSNLFHVNLIFSALDLLKILPLNYLAPYLFDRIIKRWKIFYKRSTKKMKQTVDEVHREINSSQRQVFFINPMFLPKNSVHASDPWLFGINRNGTPKDSIAVKRRHECESAKAKAGFNTVELKICKLASVGHPNKKGALEYAKAITPLAVSLAVGK